MNDVSPVVYLVEDDEAVREAISIVLRSAAIPVRSYASAEELLVHYDCSLPHCLLLDVRLPGMTGLELQQRVRIEAPGVPIVLITGHADVLLARQAFKAGAIDIIEKPVDASVLLTAVETAFGVARGLARERDRRFEIARRLGMLTSREREVMERVVAGDTNKVVAVTLGISPRTVEIYRRRVMEKLQARTLPDLVRIAGQANIFDDAFAAG
jgi:FixJ family two-component response regulator